MKLESAIRMLIEGKCIAIKRQVYEIYLCIKVISPTASLLKEYNANENIRDKIITLTVEDMLANDYVCYTNVSGRMIEVALDVCDELKNINIVSEDIKALLKELNRDIEISITTFKPMLKMSKKQVQYLRLFQHNVRELVRDFNKLKLIYQSKIIRIKQRRQDA